MKKYRFSIGGKGYDVQIEDPSSSMLVVVVNGRSYTVFREDVASSPSLHFDEDAMATTVQPPGADVEAKPALGLELVRAPIPGKILAIAVHMGERIHCGDAICTLEAMKMESVIRARVDGTVQEVRVRPGDNVQFNDVLVVVNGLAE